MRKVILGALLLLSTTVFSQTKCENDTVYMYDVPIGKYSIEFYHNTYGYYVNQRNVIITNFNMVDDEQLKLIVHENFITGRGPEDHEWIRYSYDINLSKYSVNNIIKVKNYNRDIRLTKAGKLYNSRNTVMLLGVALSAGLISANEFKAGVVISGVATLTAVILDYCGNQKLKQRKEFY
jgi:hypothetical protein